MPGPEGRSRRRRDNDDLLLLLAARRLRRERERTGGRSALGVVVIAALVLGSATAVGAALAAGKAVQAALSDCSLSGRVAKQLPTTSLVYARNCYFLGAIPSTPNRQPVGYGAISAWIRKATVAAEDRTFWTNDGLDFASIARAAVGDFAAGRAVQGGSTITQQLVRNLYLTDDKTLARKRLEACLALKLTTERKKREILAEYLNQIPYGHQALGIEAAARTYFSVPASKLGPDQAALLAGPASGADDVRPVRPPEGRARAAERGAARAARGRGALRGSLPQPRPPSARAPSRPPVQRRAHAELLLLRRVAARRRLRVYTMLDPRAERIALNAMRASLGRRGDPASALVSIDAHTGAITALASSWHGHQLKYDLPADGARQTGSAFKTFVLVDAVWNQHADPNTTWYDSSKFTYQPTPQSKRWTPRTYEGRYFGPETLTKATLLSDNVVYAKLTLDLGPVNVTEAARRMGISSPLQAVPSIGLGSTPSRR
ncbi:MAG: hypothetical protein C5B48_09410 [Candidatus Rokuibacteriota bacterium]|nr:MAG: hypothetical protein C5B48_09410 [Candidatus Rokubacteria bacterium]